MVKLRLKRMGKRHYPVYKIVAADSRFPRDGRFIEALGTYNPNIDPMEVTIKEPRIMYWLKVGAQPTDTVRNLLKGEGVMLKFQLEKKGSDVETIDSLVQKFLSDKESKFIVSREKKARRKLAKKALKNAPKEGETAKPVEVVKEVVAEVVAEAPAEVVKEVVAEVVAEAPAEVVKEVVAEVVTEAPAEVVKEVVAEVVTEAPAEVVKEVVAETPVEAVKEVASETEDTDKPSA